MRNILIKEEINHIDQVCEEYNIENYKINPDGSIDVDGDVNLYNKNLKELPLKFGKVSGYFKCTYNQLTSLEGCPELVGGDFTCDVNQLTSLNGSPSSVGGDFDCGYNKLSSLEGCPSSIGGAFYCDNNELTSLEGCPSSVGGDFYCGSNELTSLQFSPESLGGYFICSGNKLPDHFTNLYNNLSDEERKIFIKYQDDLRIWDYNEYNEEEAQILYEEIKDGMR